MFVLCVLYSKDKKAKPGQSGQKIITDEVRRAKTKIPLGMKFFASFQIGPRVHPASYAMGISCLFRGKAAGAWRKPPTPSGAEVKERVELYLSSPSVPS